MKSSDVIAALRGAYEKTHVFLEQVGEGVGMSQRRVDAVALGAWPSRGHDLHAFEVKVQRRDWLRELKAPEKSDAVAKYCHHFWIVAPAGVLKEPEVPEPWGIIQVEDGGKLTYLRKVPARRPEPLDVRFVVGILRRAEAAQQQIAAVTLAKRLEHDEATCFHRVRSEQLQELYDRLSGEYAALAGLGAGQRHPAELLQLAKQLQQVLQRREWLQQRVANVREYHHRLGELIEELDVGLAAAPALLPEGVSHDDPAAP
jgi:hypothetical protein